MKMVAEDLYEDRDRMKNEIWQQIEMAKRKHLHMTKRKEGDYVQPRMSESNVYGRQV